MTNSEPLRERVVKWVAEQGYPLEMRVASAFRRSDLRVRQSAHYVDSESGKSREIDVIGTDSEPLGMAEVHFVAECKASSKPWVLFTSPHALDNFNRLFALGICSDGARAALSETVPELRSSFPWFNKDGRIGYNLTEAFTSGGDIAYSAATSVVKACLFLLESIDRRHKPPLIFTFPVIVIESPLFECFLGDDGEVSVAEIREGWLFFDARIPNFQGTCIRVVPQAALERFSAEARVMKDQLQKLIADAVQREWQEILNREREETDYPGGDT